MLNLLTIFLVLCLVIMSGEVWVKNFHQKRRMSFTLPDFAWRSCPGCHVRFVKNERLEWVTDEIKVSLGYKYTFY